MTIKKYSKEHADLTEIIYQKMRHMVGYHDVTYEDIERIVREIGDDIIKFICEKIHGKK